MVPAMSSSTLTYVLQATSAPVIQEEDPTLRDITVSSLISWTLFP